MSLRLDKRATTNGVLAVVILLAAIYLGSGRMRHFDPALMAYTSACVLALFGIVYRYSVWLQRPPTKMYWKRGSHIILNPRHLPGNVVHLVGMFFRVFVLQTFIDRRSHVRWAAHFLISWGCIVACMVTFPLVFGWVHFDSDPGDAGKYEAFLFGFHAGSFPANSLVGWVTFHMLDFCAIAIIIGMAFAMRRRMYDRGAMATQQFAMDFLPLIMLFSICVTGLMLTASAIWMHGHSYSFIATLHAFSVIVTLLYLPFGKFFHIFQRPANLGVRFYKDEGFHGEPALCLRCGEEYTSSMHAADLQTVLDELGIDQRFENGVHYQQICPACRRKNLALNQLEAIGGPGFL